MSHPFPLLTPLLPPCLPLLVQNGFFASAGPLDIFVSQYGLPADLKFDTSGSSGTPVLHSEDADVRIEIGTEVRIKLIGIRMATDQIAVLGTIKEDFLG
jgi:DNA-directed RNA polymerase II subunit RPB7